MMIERVRVHGTDEADVVGYGPEVGKIIADLDSGLAVFAKLAAARENRGGGLDESQLQVFGERFGKRLAIPFRQLRLGIEEIKLAGTALHEHENDVLRFGGEGWLLRGKGITRRGGERSGPPIAGEQVAERDRPNASSAFTEELPPRLNLMKGTLVQHFFIPW